MIVAALQCGVSYYRTRVEVITTSVAPGAARLVVVPVHGGAIVPVDTLLSILRQAELSVDELNQLLR